MATCKINEVIPLSSDTNNPTIGKQVNIKTKCYLIIFIIHSNKQFQLILRTVTFFPQELKVFIVVMQKILTTIPSWLSQLPMLTFILGKLMKDLQLTCKGHSLQSEIRQRIRYCVPSGISSTLFSLFLIKLLIHF